MTFESDREIVDESVDLKCDNELSSTLIEMNFPSLFLNELSSTLLEMNFPFQLISVKFTNF